jgi:hypothetical protein
LIASGYSDDQLMVLLKDSCSKQPQDYLKFCPDVLSIIKNIISNLKADLDSIPICVNDRFCSLVSITPKTGENYETSQISYFDLNKEKCNENYICFQF